MTEAQAVEMLARLANLETALVDCRWWLHMVYHVLTFIAGGFLWRMLRYAVGHKDLW